MLELSKIHPEEDNESGLEVTEKLRLAQKMSLESQISHAYEQSRKLLSELPKKYLKYHKMCVDEDILEFDIDNLNISSVNGIEKETINSLTQAHKEWEIARVLKINHDLSKKKIDRNVAMKSLMDILNDQNDVIYVLENFKFFK